MALGQAHKAAEADSFGHDIEQLIASYHLPLAERKLAKRMIFESARSILSILQAELQSEQENFADDE